MFPKWEQTVAESTAQTQVRLILQKQCSEIGRMIGNALPAGTGFAFMIFDFGEKGNTAWISNAERPSMIRLMKEMIEKLEKDGG